jgi:polysaccharide biosynthesis/export protein
LKNRFLTSISARCSLVLVLFLIAIPSRAQRPFDSSRSLQTDRDSLRQDTSELAKENSDRVAAAAPEIQAILAKDSGLLVELKHIVAREATSNGQVVDDTELTDQAIFDRLTHDVGFRATATRLLRRYGYLLPAFNPNSEIAKQQDLVLKERARRLVQIEEKENQESLLLQNAGNKSGEFAELNFCDHDSDPDCITTPQSGGRLSDRKNVEQEPDSTTAPKHQRSNSSQILQTADTHQDVDISDGLPSPADSMLSGANRARSSGEDGLQLASLIGSDARPNALPPGVSSSPSTSLRPDVTAKSDAVIADGFPIRTMRPSGPRAKLPDRDLSPVAMVHKPNPYSDVPSLFDMYVQASAKTVQPERFGLSIFRSDSLQSNAIPMDLPVGPEYVVGPGDGLTISIWGGVSQRMLRVVDRAGRVNLPEVGPVLVSGHTLGDVQTTVQQLLRTQFRDISADVSLSRLRTVRVYVVGEVIQPGAYDISSLSTPLNALYAAGGITPRGSMRALKHFRGKQLVEEVDAYSLLLHGVQGELAHLENGDTLLVPPVGPQVTIDGMVRRPAIYELTGESNLADVLELAGGILPAAALKHIEVQRLEAHEKRTMLSVEVSETNAAAITKQLADFKIQDGDQIHLFPIAPYNESAVYLQGHVQRPGRYSFRDGMKLADLVASYNDLLPEPARHYAEIIRLKPPDYRPTVESFDLAAALENPAAAPSLNSHDTIRIFSRYDFEPAPWVWVGGEVRSPGKYNTSGQVHLRDALYLAGGPAPNASLDSAQLFRTQTDGKMQIFNINLREALNGNPMDNLLLEPRDRLLIQKNLASVEPATVDIRGEVARPGRYPLGAGMSVQDLLSVAGGLKRSADPEIADLTRYSATAPSGSAGSSTPVNLSAIANGNATENLSLHPGDVLTVRERPGWSNVGASVTLRGEVMHPGTYGIQPGERLSSVIQRAGGFSPEAYPYGAVLMRREVREMELRSRDQLVQRVKSEQLYLRAQPETDAEQKTAKLTALAQTDTALTQLMANDPVGRLVLHVNPSDSGWNKTAEGVPLQAGDVLVVPKKAQYVTVMGQVFNPTAVGFQSGRSAKWYLSQAGGLTQLADKKGVFVVRANGSVIAAKNNSGWWSGDPMGSVLRPGDSIVVPEKALNVGPRNWAPVLQAAQVAASVALTVAYIKP